jgi:TonB family protein
MRNLLLFSLVVAVCLGPAAPAQGQSSGDSTRQVVRRTVPKYPDVARRMNIAGTVKVFAVVAPDGKVKSVQPMGGSPLLIQAAQEAVSQWKYAPASSESKELVELHFSPE